LDGSFPQFSIFSGVMGTGKSTSAGIAALTLLCEDKQNGAPCLKCQSCQDSIKALGTGSGIHLSKKNFGLLDKKIDVNNLIEEVFKLSAEGRCVYIFEEFHSLPQNMQIAFLEEIDLLPKDIYVIICTTKIYNILPELVSRSVSFEFKKLNRKDSANLVKFYTQKKRILLRDEKIISSLLDYTAGIPRNIVNLIDFLMTGTKSYEDIIEFLNLVSEDDFFELFDSMKLDFGNFVTVMHRLLEDQASNFVKQLKQFWLNFMFYPDVVLLNKKKCEELKSSIPSNIAFKICRRLDSLKANAEESDVKFAMIDLYSLVNKTSGALQNSIADQRDLQVKNEEISQEITSSEQFVFSAINFD
jgi:DNA polymerase-3 subunit gamma/tau